MLRRLLALLALVILNAGTTKTMGQVPSISGTTPQAVAPGSDTDVIIRGGNLANPTKVISSFAGAASLTPGVKDNGKNGAQSSWRFSVPKDAAVGIHAVRVATAGGVSAPRLIMVDDLKSVAQAGGNTSREKAQLVTLPIAVDGAVPNLGHSYFKFAVTAGQKVSFEVVARRLGSSLDPMIRLLDGKGRELAWSDDVSGLRSDSQICHTFETAGEYFVEVRDIRYQSGPFRLRMGDFPCITAPLPTGVTLGQTAKVKFAGPDSADVGEVEVQGAGANGISWTNVSAKRPGGSSSGFAMIKLSNNGEALESEPNNDVTKATRVDPGFNLSGRIDQPGDQDYFVFAGKAGQKLSFNVVTRRLGTPTSAFVRVLDKAGKQLAAVEDFGIGDKSLNYNIPTDGDYIVAVSDLHGRGGPQFAYRIEVTPNTPTFVLNASTNTINVPAGSTAMITVTSARKGYNGPIKVSVEGLPEGFVSEPTVLGPGINTVVLTVSNRSDKSKGQPVAVNIVGRAEIAGKEHQVVALTDAPLKSAMANIPWVPQSLSGRVAVGVAKQPQIRLRVEPNVATFGKNLSGKVKVIAERAKGFDEAIALTITPDPKKGGLPGNVTAGLKPIPKGQNSVEIAFNATDKAALGDFTAVLVGTIKQGKTTVTQPAPGVTLRLQNSLAVTATPTVSESAAGGQLKVKVMVQRNPALTGEAVLTFAGLPKGVTAPAAKIAADKNEAELTLPVAADAAKGAAAEVTVKAEVTVGKVKHVATSAKFTLTVE